MTGYPAEDGLSTTVEHLYVNQLVPLAMSRQGVPAFHASVVTIAGGAVAFLGQSGMGKSTLAASFALNGARFLTDDALLIEERPDGCLALPSHASVRLWDDSVAALTNDDVPQADGLCYTDKARLLAGSALAFCDAAKPLLGAYILQSNSALRDYDRACVGCGTYDAVGRELVPARYRGPGTPCQSLRLEPPDILCSTELLTGLSARLWHAGRRAHRSARAR